MNKPAPVEEFDEYAAGYDAGMSNPLKRLVGSSPADFLRVKVRWLLADLRRWGRLTGTATLLDYGCGPGDFLAELVAAGLPGRPAGCDVSGRMLDLARARRGPAEFFHPTAGEVAARTGRYDVVTISAVLHHVPLPDRPGVYRNLLRLLKPTGRLYVFEHNPLNPVTVWVVRNTPIDRNAQLVSAAGVRRGLRDAGFDGLRTRYLMFFPPRLTWLRSVETAFQWLPLGGQFVVRAERAMSRSINDPLAVVGAGDSPPYRAAG
jgi:2-polyprenyl-3-methyl-5-hydroxy-6-metoxy-1,4-benzoquinol methylase